MVMPNNPQRPALTPEERASLQNAEGHLRMVNGVLTDLAEIGADVSADIDLFQRTETMRAGLLDKFSTGTLTPKPSVRARK